MGEQWFKSCLPEEYYERFIREGVYPDGRSVLAFNPLFFKCGAWGGVGSALVKLGGVAVSCTVEASLALIHDGPLVTCEIDACTSVPQAEVSDMTNTLNSVFANESLSLRSALLVKWIDEKISMTWELTLRVQILNSDGPILDAVFCAASAALFDVRLPSVSLAHVSDDESPIRQEEISLIDGTTPLSLKAFPLAFTFHIFRCNKKDTLLVDPPQDLIETCSARVSFVTDRDNLIAMWTRGRLKNDHLISSMASLAAQRHRNIMSAIRTQTSSVYCLPSISNREANAQDKIPS